MIRINQFQIDTTARTQREKANAVIRFYENKSHGENDFYAWKEGRFHYIHWMRHPRQRVNLAKMASIYDGLRKEYAVATRMLQGQKR